MTQKHALHAFIATLVTLLLVLVSTFVAAYFVPGLISKVEAFGLGTVTGGLTTLAAGIAQRRSTPPGDAQ